MIGPDGDKTGLFGTRTGQKEFGYLLAVGENGFLNVRIAAHVFYLPEGGATRERISYAETGFVGDLMHECYYRILGKDYSGRDSKFAEQRRGRFFNIDGKPVELSYASSDPEVMAIEREGDNADTIVFKKTGKVRLIVRLGDAIVGKIPLEVVPSPVRVGMTNEELLKQFGFPSDEGTEYASWPKGNSLNREYRAPTAAQGTIAIRHVRYKAFPELVVSLDSEGRVKGWHSNTEHARKR